MVLCWALECWVAEDDLALMCRLEGVDASLMRSARPTLLGFCLSSQEQKRRESPDASCCPEAFERD